jgi:hypothetical protein
MTFLLLASAMMTSGHGQDAPSCGSVPTAEIAFRAGDFDASIVGTQIRAGSSKVRWISAGCALFEDWEGAVSGTGSAIYVHHTGRWHLYFVNSTGHTLALDGTAIDGGVQFEGDHPDLDGRPGSHRLIFAREGNDVRQTWYFRPARTGQWELLVDMIQRRRPVSE